MKQLIDDHGSVVTLGREIGSGGEGTVYEVDRDPGRVAKIYHRAISSEKAEKLRFMAAVQCPELTRVAAWPLSTLHSTSGGQTTGILLPLIREHAEIHCLYSPAQRKVRYPDRDWKFLVHVAMNCSCRIRRYPFAVPCDRRCESGKCARLSKRHRRTYRLRLVPIKRSWQTLPMRSGSAAIHASGASGTRISRSHAK